MSQGKTHRAKRTSSVKLEVSRAGETNDVLSIPHFKQERFVIFI